MRGIGAEMLKELGFQMVTAGDGREGIAAFKQHPDVKVIMSSGFSEHEVTGSSLAKGWPDLSRNRTNSLLKNVIRGIL